MRSLLRTADVWGLAGNARPMQPESGAYTTSAPTAPPRQRRERAGMFRVCFLARSPLWPLPPGHDPRLHHATRAATSRTQPVARGLVVARAPAHAGVRACPACEPGLERRRGRRIAVLLGRR